MTASWVPVSRVAQLSTAPTPDAVSARMIAMTANVTRRWAIPPCMRLATIETTTATIAITDCARRRTRDTSHPSKAPSGTASAITVSTMRSTGVGAPSM